MAIELSGREVFTTLPETHRIARKGSGLYFSRCILLPGDKVEYFEEVPIDELPQNNEEE